MRTGLLSEAVAALERSKIISLVFKIIRETNVDQTAHDQSKCRIKIDEKGFLGQHVSKWGFIDPAMHQLYYIVEVYHYVS